MARFLFLFLSGAYCTSFSKRVRTGLKKMSDSWQKPNRLVKDGRRLGIERRIFTYSAYIPERRSGRDRRCVKHPARMIKKRIEAEPRTWTPNREGIEGTCWVLDNPEPDCYCLNLTSDNLPNAVQYCLKDFRQCPIYNRCMEMPEA